MLRKTKQKQKTRRERKSRDFTLNLCGKYMYTLQGSPRILYVYNNPHDPTHADMS